MNKTSFILASIFCLFNLSEVCYALDINTKMGKPTKEELSMTEYSPDPDAEAVVLYSNTDVVFEIRADQFKLVTRYKKRIKILKEDGKSEGDIAIVVYDSEDGGRDVLSGLKGITYNLENGQVVKSKASSDLKNEQRLDRNFVVKKISMPNVVVGSVIEFEYEISSNDIVNIDPWYAQEDIPVFYTEYNIEVPDWFRMRTNQTGFHPLTTQREESNFIASVGGQILTTTSVKEHFEGHEMPRIKDDDYVFCLNDYNTKVTKELTNFIIPGRIFESYNQDWSKEFEALLKSAYFGQLCDDNTPEPFKKIGSSSWPEEFSIKQKIDSIRNLLWSQYSWNESYGLYARNIRNLNKEKSGNNATLNFALLNMLNEAGIKTYPVVLRSRTKGRLPFMPSRKHLNAMVLCSVDPSDNSYIYFDAGSKNYPVGTIPYNYLVQKAFILTPETKKYNEVDLQNVCKGSQISSLTLTIDEEGQLSGKSLTNHRGLAAADFRNSFKQEASEEEYIQKVSASSEIQINDYKVTNIHNSEENVIESYDLSKQLDIEDGHIYLNPFIGKNFTSNFKEEKRDLPIEMPYSLIIKHTISIQIPEHFEVEEMPKSIRLKMPNNEISIRMNFQLAENSIHISYNFNRNALFFDTTQYELLRNFYTTLEQAGNERIVLKKKQ